ncbi:DUF1344 domain-containing protein [Mesorhizobium xinjiangense]|uniref:DUF1344 domain-containing protein n=1 Tax=Mesorhizobium xinjiangense TaxID=2678685 RepID=UPI0012ED92B0|nr:DUF1344 domain-containing protein [Mesorhizobium xinjiangense]
MRVFFAAIAAAFVLSGPALAETTDGVIQTVDAEKLTITLEDGKTYKLPGEIDMLAIKEGLEILIAYDEINGVNLITDMEVFE